MSERYVVQALPASKQRTPQKRAVIEARRPRLGRMRPSSMFLAKFLDVHTLCPFHLRFADPDRRKLCRLEKCWLR